jgi:2-(1,2-epoxy-1,2-dihydrophenyl)acetyl-CoA isomerase
MGIQWHRPLALLQPADRRKLPPDIAGRCPGVQHGKHRWFLQFLSPRTRNRATADVLVERDGTVGVITINRPTRLNAVTPDAGDTLRSAFLELEADGRIRAVVLTGAGRGFRAGADISGDVGNAREVLLQAWNPLVMTMRSLQIPIIAAVNGVAAGAGVSLALACDLRVAAASTRFELSFAKIGLMPDAGLTWLLPRVVGLGRANEMALLCWEGVFRPPRHVSGAW